MIEMQINILAKKVWANSKSRSFIKKCLEQRIINRFSDKIMISN